MALGMASAMAVSAVWVASAMVVSAVWAASAMVVSAVWAASAMAVSAVSVDTAALVASVASAILVSIEHCEVNKSHDTTLTRFQRPSAQLFQPYAI